MRFKHIIYNFLIVTNCASGLFLVENLSSLLTNRNPENTFSYNMSEFLSKFANNTIDTVNKNVLSRTLLNRFLLGQDLNLIKKTAGNAKNSIINTPEGSNALLALNQLRGSLTRLFN